MPLKAILFDLDDTLYDEYQYVVSGFRAVAAFLSQMTDLGAEEIFNRLIEDMEQHGRELVFDRVLTEIGLSNDPGTVGNLVRHYREHRPSLSFYPEAANLLRSLRPRYRLAAVTDGLPVMQRNKVEALGLEPLVDHIIYTWEIKAPKPDPLGFVRALQLLETDAEQTMLVADHPVKDLLPGAKLGLTLVRVRTGRESQEQDHPDAPADFTLSAVADLPAILDEFEA